MGFRYLRNAESGGSAHGNGRRSGGNLDSSERLARVGDSFRDAVGVVRLENNRAADLKRRKEAVRLDLREGLVGGRSLTSLGSRCSGLKLDASSRSGYITSRGWSVLESSGRDEEMLFDLRPRDPWLLHVMPGVEGLLDVSADSVSVSSDGIDSLESDRNDDRGSSAVFPLPTLEAYSSMSCGGLNSSLQECGLDSDGATPLASLSAVSSNKFPMSF